MSLPGGRKADSTCGGCASAGLPDGLLDAWMTAERRGQVLGRILLLAGLGFSLFGLFAWTAIWLGRDNGPLTLILFALLMSPVLSCRLWRLAIRFVRGEIG